jgi:flagellar motor switch protein FliG
VEFTSEPGYTPATSGLSPREIIERASPKALSFILSDERPQIIAFVLSLLPEKKKDEVLSSIGSQKNLVIDLINGIKKSPFSAQVEEKLLKYFSEKLK